MVSRRDAAQRKRGVRNVKTTNAFGTTQFDRHARRGVWTGHFNGESCLLLVVDDLEDDDEEANFKSVIQLSDWDGRPAMSSRVFDTADVLCEDAKWLGEAFLKLTRRLDNRVPTTHVGQIYVSRKRPYLLVLDELARLREHNLEGVVHKGDDGDGYYDWELYYWAQDSAHQMVRILTSAEVDSWINDWSPPSYATSISRLPRR